MSRIHPYRRTGTGVLLNGASEPAALLVEVMRDTHYYEDYMAGNGVYEYWIRSKNSAGLSDFSKSVQGWRLSLEAPASLFASDRTYPDRIRITWDIVPGVGYEVLRSTLDHNGTCRSINWSARGPFYDDFDIVPKQVYYYWLRSGDSGKSLSLFSPSASGYSAPRE